MVCLQSFPRRKGVEDEDHLGFWRSVKYACRYAGLMMGTRTVLNSDAGGDGSHHHGMHTC